MSDDKNGAGMPNMIGTNFIARNGIKALVALVAIGVVYMVAEPYLAASPSARSKSTEADGRPRVEVVHPRRITVAQRLQTNATLEAFEETDIFAKISGYLSDVRVDIGDHVKAGQVLAVIYVPEMENELAEAKAHSLPSKVRWSARAMTWTTTKRT
jgi:multidrug efflux pump subunit AcrA (membrane-fusion protein)